MDDRESLGDIKINNEVLVMIASLAVVEVAGVVNLAGKYSLAELWGRKDMDKGVTVEIGKDNMAVVTVEVNVEYGIDIYRAARQLQLSVKNALESMTAIHVKAVNVTIRGAVLGDQPRRPSVARGIEIQAIAGGE